MFNMFYISFNYNLFLYFKVKCLQERCFDLENKYLHKCELLNAREKEIYLARVILVI